jgi:hypothetical protein
VATSSEFRLSFLSALAPSCLKTNELRDTPPSGLWHGSCFSL